MKKIARYDSSKSFEEVLFINQCWPSTSKLIRDNGKATQWSQDHRSKHSCKKISENFCKIQGKTTMTEPF